MPAILSCEVSGRSRLQFRPTAREEMLYMVAFPTALGWMAFAVADARLRRLSFGHEESAAAMSALGSDRGQVIHRPTGWGRELAERLEAYATGERVSFDDIETDTAYLTPFGQAVVRACRAIPFGRTQSYQELAARAGRPNAARAVGQVMAHNRVPLIVPCHRVLAANRRIGGFSAPQGGAMKRRLLALEGVEIP